MSTPRRYPGCRSQSNLPAYLIVALLGSLCGWSTTSPAAEPTCEKTPLFIAGQAGYALYRIPGLVVTQKGNLLAYCEARKGGSGDWGAIDIQLRRSTDAGKTWDAPRTIAHFGAKVPKNPVAVAQKLGREGDVTVNNPVAIVDRQPGVVHFLYCVEYARCFYQRSDDDGLTFSAPVDITAAIEKLRDQYDWKVVATGPAHGIQLRSGRLVVPVWLSTGTGGHAHRPSRVTSIYSDDGGKTWLAGELIPASSDCINPNETIVTELADGQVLFNIRSESLPHRRAISVSKDGATGWSAPEFHHQLLEPICMASIARLSQQPAGKNRLLFANPHTLDPRDGMAVAGKSRTRKNLTVQLSYDEGKTWPVRRALEPGLSGYSDLAVSKDGEIYCLYESGTTNGDIYRSGSLVLAKFNLEWLTEGKDSFTNQEPAPQSNASPANIKAEICIYGGTSGGVTAAIQAMRAGHTVVIVEPGQHLGGMSAGGLGWTDFGHKTEKREIGGLAREFYQRVGKHYNKSEEFTLEPHIAAEVFNNWVAEYKIPVRYQQRLATVRKTGPHITALVMEDGTTYTAQQFIDATYEGDLLALASVSYVVGRESNAQYGETVNGIQGPATSPRAGQFETQPDPYIKPGDAQSGLLPLIQPGNRGKVGAADARVQAYNYRVCLTPNVANQLPLEPPVGYDPTHYELIARWCDARLAKGEMLTLADFLKYDPLPNHKYDFNNRWAISTDLMGGSEHYPEADDVTRQQIAAAHDAYLRGFFHFLATSPRVPEAVRHEMSRFGLCRDEFVANRGWPHQLYVREARRMVSDLVMTEAHCRGKKLAEQPIALAAYGIDIHGVRRIVADGKLENEGSNGAGVPQPYPIGYGSIVPKATQCDNLFAPFALSASHVAFGSIRMEPVFMALSQSAATAACLAIEDNVPVQKVDYSKLKERLLKAGQVLAWPPENAK